MCIVSFVGNHYEDKWNNLRPIIYTTGTGQIPTIIDPINPTAAPSQKPTLLPQAEFDALKKEVEDMKVLLKKAKIYDEENNEPNCEMESKVAFLKKVAEFVGVDLEDVFKPKQ